MPDSPSQRDPDPPPPSSPASPSSAQLASLLAEALKDAEILRRDLSITKKRAEDFERRYLALSSLSDPKSDTSRIIHELDQRATEAEAARDDSEARRRAVLDSWHQLDRYLQSVELRASDARAGFAKLLSDGTGAPLVLSSIPLPPGFQMPFSYPAPGSMPPPQNHAARTPYPTSRPSPHGHRSSQSQSFPPMALPPHPTPNANGRRPREESVDRSGYVDTLAGQPPQKKLKGFGDDRRGRDERTTYSESNLAYLHQRHQPLPPQAIESRERIYRPPQARMIVPPTGGDPEYANHRARSRSRSRSSSRSSRSSLSVDEMLLEAANGNGGGTPGSAGDATSQRSHRRRHHREDPSHQRYPSSNEPTLHPIQSQQQQQQPPQQQHNPPRPQGDSPPPQQQLIHNYRPRAPHASASVPLVTENHVAAMPAPCHVQTIQTHVFAPVVTGAPQKKNKFSASGGSVGNLATTGTGSADAPPPTPQHIYPQTNSQGQRICRQCGMAGRYKEGKCVEKWGPGPMGPGTVCDRCRKKMKRVERRGNLESQQLSASNSLNNIGALHPSQHPHPHPPHPHPHQQQQQPQQTQPVPPRNVLQQSQSVPSVSSTSSDRGIHRSDTLVNTSTYRDESDARSALVAAVSGNGSSKSASSANHNGGNGNGRVPLSPPPSIASINDELPLSNVGRGAGAARAAAAAAVSSGPGNNTSSGGSRGGSRNDRSSRGGASSNTANNAASQVTTTTTTTTGGKRSPGSGGGSRTSSISPSQMDMDADGDVDADADAEAEAEAEAEVEIEGEGEGENEGEAEVDVEIEEAASGGGGHSGGGGEAETDADDEILEAADGRR